MRYLLLLLCIVMAASASAQIQYLGSPTTTVRNRGNFVSDSLFYLPKRQKAPSDTGAIRYAISDSSVYVWTGYQWNKLSPGAFVAIGDTASMLSPYTRGSGTTNYLPIFNSTRSFTNSKIYSSGTSYYLDDTTTGGIGVNYFIRNTKAGGTYNYASLQLRSNNDTVSASIFTDGIGVQVPNRGMSIGTITNHDLEFRTNDSRRIRLTKDGEFFVNGTTDQGAYNVQVYGGIYAGSNSSNVSLLIEPGKSIRSTGSVYFDVGATSGDLYIRTGSGLSSTFTAFGSGRVGINTTTDLGYNAQVIGTLYNSSSAVFAAGSGAVGIGTTSAVEKLEVSGNVQINGITFFKYANGGGYFGSGTVVSGNAKETALRADSSLIFSAGGATEAARFNIQREFLIGGGSDAGAYALQVAGAIYNTTGAVFSASSGEVYVGSTTDNGGYRFQVTGGMYVIDDAVFGVTSGNVGIGTSSPNVKLNVNGSSNSSVIRLSNTANNANDYVQLGFTGIGVNADYAAVRTIFTSGLNSYGATALAFLTYPDFPGNTLTERMRITQAGEVWIGSTSDAGAYALQVTGAIYNTTTLTTGAPTSGTAKPWRLGEAATVSPTSPNRTIRVEIDGTVYYLHAKTTND